MSVMWDWGEGKGWFEQKRQCEQEHVGKGVCYYYQGDEKYDPRS